MDFFNVHHLPVKVKGVRLLDVYKKRLTISLAHVHSLIETSSNLLSLFFPHRLQVCYPISSFINFALLNFQELSYSSPKLFLELSSIFKMTLPLYPAKKSGGRENSFSSFVFVRDVYSTLPLFFHKINCFFFFSNESFPSTLRGTYSAGKEVVFKSHINSPSNLFNN